jgi:hypothetical protein
MEVPPSLRSITVSQRGVCVHLYLMYVCDRACVRVCVCACVRVRVCVGASASDDADGLTFETRLRLGGGGEGSSRSPAPAQLHAIGRMGGAGGGGLHPALFKTLIFVLCAHFEQQYLKLADSLTVQVPLLGYWCK